MTVPITPSVPLAVNNSWVKYILSILYELSIIKVKLHFTPLIIKITYNM